MKKLVFLLLAGIMLQACQHITDYKAVRQQVLDAHDQVMINGGIAIANKMKLDTLKQRLDSLEKIDLISDTSLERKKIEALTAKLNYADEQMNNWMHGFEAELGEKSLEDALNYFKNEMKKVNTLDSVYKAAIAESDTYLKQFKK